MPTKPRDIPQTEEHKRLEEIHDSTSGWRRWGPYVSDRAWATVREDYSDDGEAWDYLPHDLSRSKAYRWGEDGIAGWSDRYQLIVFAPAFWNGRDKILKERLFGLAGPEGNHGEDVKEYYFYVDATPSHSYLRFLYKYPQAEFPYETAPGRERPTRGHRARIRAARHRDLRRGPLLRHRGRIRQGHDGRHRHPDQGHQPRARPRPAPPDPPPLVPEHLVLGPEARGLRPRSTSGRRAPTYQTLITDDSMVETLATVPVAYRIGARTFYAAPGGAPLFTNNETNFPKVYGPGSTNASPHVKDAFHRQIVDGEDATNPDGIGTKAAIHYRFDAVQPGETVTLRFRLTDTCYLDDPLAGVDDSDRPPPIRGRRLLRGHPPATRATADEKLVQRQALASMIWTKQAYLFDVDLWLKGDNPDWPPPKSRETIRNQHWKHLNSMRVMTVCDKWEYPWFAAWDLAFQCIPFALVDPDFAKNQLWVLLFEQFQHPNGQIPAYEWEFSDLNPPVHAWAVWRVYNMDRIRSGKADREWLERCFHKLMINFTWWVNKVDKEGNNVFEGGLPRAGQHHGRRPLQADATTARRSSSPTPPAGWGCSA